MSAIVGMIHKGEVYLGADSYCGRPEGVSAPTMTPKMFRLGELLIGCVGGFRVPQVIRYCTDLPAWPAEMDAHEFLVASFVPAARTALEEQCCVAQECGAESLQTCFLVGARGRLFEIGGDWSVIEAEHYGAIGRSEDVAYGAFHALQETWKNCGFEPDVILAHVLDACAAHCNVVCPPFHIERA